MAETLLQYLTKRNPTVISFGLGRSAFTYNEDWETVEDLEVWSEFNYATLISRFGEELQREVPRNEATVKSEEGGFNRIYDENGLSDLVLLSIMGPVSAVLGALFITSGGRTMESLGCCPDWGAGHEHSRNTNGRAKALVLGDTKYNWSSISAIDTVRRRVNDSYEDAPTRDDVRPIEQVEYYGSLYRCRYVFVITEKELVVMRLHLAPDPVRTSPRPVRTHPLAAHQRVISSSTISRQFSDMSIHESDLKPRIGLAKYKTIPWSANSGLTVKLALYCLIRLAHEDGIDLEVDYPPMASSAALPPSPSVSTKPHAPRGKTKEADQESTTLPTSSSNKRKVEPKTQATYPSRKKSRDQLSGTPSQSAAGSTTINQPRYIDVKVQWNQTRTGYNYAVGDAKVSDNWVINDPPGNWQELPMGKIYNFTKTPHLRSSKP